MPKLVALCVGAAIFFFYFIFKMVAPAGGPPPVAAASPSPGSVASTTGAGSTAAPAAPPDAFPIASINMLGRGRDPFVPNGAATANPSAPPPAPAPPYIPNTNPNGVLKTLRDGRLFGGQPMQFNRVMPGGRGKAGTPEVIVLPPPPPPAITLTGIIQGESGGIDVAIARVSDPAAEATGPNSNRKYLVVGDPVGNGYIVSAIRSDHIEIRTSNPNHADEAPINVYLGDTEKSRAQ